MPKEKFSIIYADPPWRYEQKNRQGSAELHYPTMSIEEICSLPVADLAAKDSVLFLWATFPQLPEALKVIKAWGFSYRSVAFVWIKRNRRSYSWFYGLGYWTRGNAEICLLAVKGHPKRKSAGVHQLIVSPIERHSKKPDEARRKIVELISSTVASILCGFVFFGVTDILFKVLFSAVYGLLIAISALPLVLLIVFFSRSYIFSIMLCVFYSVFNLLSTFSMTALPKWLVLTLPTPSIMLWGTQQMSSRTAINDTEDLQNFIQMGLIPSTPQLIITLGVIGVVSLLLAVYLYKKRSE